MRLAAFDLEIAKQIPQGAGTWLSYAPLGISCAAVAFGDDEDRFLQWYGIPQMTDAECRSMVGDLQELVRNGYTLVSWNGCKFDFAVLAFESGMRIECAELALDHVDLMLRVTFEKGWYLSLQKALKGAGLEGKLETVTLSDGTQLEDMDGSKAPMLWAAGECRAVLQYLRKDVAQLLALAQALQRCKIIRWISNSGNLHEMRIDRLLTVRECFDIPEPDVSWMTDPPTREQFVHWMRPLPELDSIAQPSTSSTELTVWGDEVERELSPEGFTVRAQFRAGDHVRHPQFGEGIVLSSKVLGDDEEVTVVFEGLGPKRCLTSFANMEKLRDQ